MGEHPLQHQRQAEGQQQAVKVVLIGDGTNQEALHQHTDKAHCQRHQHQRCPVIDAHVVQRQPGSKGPQHIHGTLSEVNDLEQTKDDCQPQAEQSIERAIDQADQQLAEQTEEIDSKKCRHSLVPFSPA